MILTPNSSDGHFNYLHDVYREEIDPTLKASVVAAGLAAYANTSKSARLMRQARKNYAVALRSINTALKSPEDAIKDNTLISILVVSIFETITGTSRLSMEGWTEHINGASSLLQLRGRSQIHTSKGLRLFIHVTSHLLVSCFQREMPMPPQLLELRIEASQLAPLSPAMQILKVIDELTVFRTQVRDRTLSGYQTIISTALRYDAKLVQIVSNIPPGWLYETIYADDDPDIIWNGCYDIYYDYGVAQIWNGVRSARIMLHETIQLRLLEGFTSIPPSVTPAEFTMQFWTSTDILVNMWDGILRSIPQHIGYVTRKLSRIQMTARQGLQRRHFDRTSFTDLLEGTSTFSSHSPHQNFNSGAQAFIPPPSTPAIGGYFLSNPSTLQP